MSETIPLRDLEVGDEFALMSNHYRVLEDREVCFLCENLFSGGQVTWFKGDETATVVLLKFEGMKDEVQG